MTGLWCLKTEVYTTSTSEQSEKARQRNGRIINSKYLLSLQATWKAALWLTLFTSWPLCAWNLRLCLLFPPTLPSALCLPRGRSHQWNGSTQVRLYFVEFHHACQFCRSLFTEYKFKTLLYNKIIWIIIDLLLQQYCCWPIGYHIIFYLLRCTCILWKNFYFFRTMLSTSGYQATSERFGSGLQSVLHWTSFVVEVENEFRLRKRPRRISHMKRGLFRKKNFTRHLLTDFRHCIWRKQQWTSLFIKLSPSNG